VDAQESTQAKTTPPHDFPASEAASVSRLSENFRKKNGGMQNIFFTFVGDAKKSFD
jgi:hypothetical protein